MSGAPDVLAREEPAPQLLTKLSALAALSVMDRHFIDGTLAGDSLEVLAAKLNRSRAWGGAHMTVLRARFGVPTTAALIATLTSVGAIEPIASSDGEVSAWRVALTI